MTKLIVGLGNPGKKYEKTRHNVGFMLLNAIAKEENIAMQQERNRSTIGKGTVAGTEVVLAKPQTFMNASGEAVLSLVTAYKVKPADVIVIFDDMALQHGRIRVRQGGSAGGHNGVKSVIHAIGDRFVRIRIGVGAAADDTVRFVLSDFSPEEARIISEITPDVYNCVREILTNGVEAAMNMYNGLHKASNQGGGSTHGI